MNPEEPLPLHPSDTEDSDSCDSCFDDLRTGNPQLFSGRAAITAATTRETEVELKELPTTEGQSDGPRPK